MRTPWAELVGSVNIMRVEPDGQWRGDIMDGEGFVAGLLAAGHLLAGLPVLIAGASGVGAAVAFALTAADVGRSPWRMWTPGRPTRWQPACALPG